MQPFIDRLKELGFSEYEAKAYIALLSNPASTGYELAKASGIPGSKIYMTLQKLMTKNVISLIAGDPQKYMAHDPKEIVARYRKNYKSLFDDLVSDFSNLKIDDHSSQIIWNLNSREEIFRFFREQLEQCTEELLLSVWEKDLAEIEDDLRGSESCGQKAHIVIFGEKELDFGTVYHHGREKLILRERGQRRMNVVFDNKHVLIGHFTPEGNATAVFTSNPALVLLARDYIVHDIYTIKIAQKFGQEAQELFGL